MVRHGRALMRLMLETVQRDHGEADLDVDHIPSLDPIPVPIESDPVRADRITVFRDGAGAIRARHRREQRERLWQAILPGPDRSRLPASGCSRRYNDAWRPPADPPKDIGLGQ